MPTLLTFCLEHTMARRHGIRRTILALAALPASGLVLGSPAALAAQSDHDGHGDHTSPYADLTDRAIKALSAEEVAGLEAGEGLGFALAAELNGVPGPLHVLEMRQELGLTGGQADSVRDIELRMQERARSLGARILELEGELDQRFAHGHVTAADVARLSGEIGAAQGELRAVHLVAHLETAAVLDVEQVEAYRELRGYGPAR